MRNPPVHGAAVVNRLGSLEPRSPGDKGNREFEFPPLWLVQPGHMTRNTGLWLDEPGPRTAAMFKSTIAGMRPGRASTPMFLSRAPTISALFLKIKPWKLTEIRDMYNRNISTNTGPHLGFDKFRSIEENLLENFFPFPASAGGWGPRWRPGSRPLITLWALGRHRNWRTFKIRCSQ